MRIKCGPEFLSFIATFVGDTASALPSTFWFRFLLADGFPFSFFLTFSLGLGSSLLELSMRRLNLRY